VSHEISLAVWDLPSPVVAGQRATLKVGVSCPDGCDLSGTAVDIYNETGERVGAGTLGSAPWPATTALYWAEVDLVALERDGLEHAGTVPTGPQSCGLATTPEAVWVSDTEPFLQQVDPATRTVLAEVTTDTGSCGDVRVAHGSIWATAADDDVLYRLDP